MQNTLVTDNAEKGNRGPTGHCKTVEVAAVKVQYVGKSDWQETVLNKTPLWLIKQNAMREFGLDLTEQKTYVLQYHNADQDDCDDVGDFEKDHVILKLTLVDEPIKG